MLRCAVVVAAIAAFMDASAAVAVVVAVAVLVLVLVVLGLLHSRQRLR